MDPKQNSVFSLLHTRMSERFEILSSSLTGTCRVLEWDANKRKNLIESSNDTALETIRKISNEVAEYLEILNESCDKIVQTNFTNETFFTLSESIEIPFSIQLDTVNSLKKIYTSLADEQNDSENKVVNDKLIEFTLDAIRIVKNNIGEFENLENLFCFQI